MTWRDHEDIVHIVETMLVIGRNPSVVWPICYSKRHPKEGEALSKDMPTCLWCIATRMRRP